jgi:SAM-dependent methyltransferase
MLETLLSPARKAARFPPLAKALSPVHSARRRLVERRRRHLVVKELGSAPLLGRFAREEDLPPGYGMTANERVIEIPWLFAQRPAGRMLDAGSSLNHVEFLERFQPKLDELHIVTLAYEGVAHPRRGISYVYADLRSLPYADDYFDVVASISTLEHVGMDNTSYGSSAARAADPAAEADSAIRELARVTRRGGRLFFSVPYGQAEDHGGFRQLDSDDVERLIQAAAPQKAQILVYRHSRDGWRLSDLEAARLSRYRTGFAAEAVACVQMTK